MIIYSWGRDSVDLGLTSERYHCNECDEERPFRLYLQYRYWGLFWIFCFTTHRKYTKVCTYCQNGWELPAAEIEPSLESVPIPFMRRYGLAVFGAAVLNHCAWSKPFLKSIWEPNGGSKRKPLRLQGFSRARVFTEDAMAAAALQDRSAGSWGQRCGWGVGLKPEPFPGSCRPSFKGGAL